MCGQGCGYECGNEWPLCEQDVNSPPGYIMKNWSTGAYGCEQGCEQRCEHGCDNGVDIGLNKSVNRGANMGVDMCANMGLDKGVNIV